MFARARFWLSALLPVLGCWAQAGKVELFGVVRDAADLPIPEVRVVAEAQATNRQFATRTVEGGAWHLMGLEPGEYRLRFEKDGFKVYQRTGVELRVADRIAVDVRLEVGDVRESLEVRAAAPWLETSRGSLSYVVESRQVAALPLDGRNFVPLMALLPGVAQPPGSAFPRINGSRPRTSEYLYDGISVWRWPRGTTSR